MNMQGITTKRSLLQRLATRDDNLNRLILISLAIFVLMTILNPGRFATMRNFRSMSYSFPELGLLALGLTLCMITGGIDLSVVGTANLTAILAAKVMAEALPVDAAVGTVWLYMALAIVLSLAVGVVAGLINGYLIATFKIHPVLVTLGTWQVFSGIAIVITQGRAVPGFPQQFLFLGNGTLLGFPMPLYVFIAFAIVVAILLTKTQFGVSVYLIGTNITAARFAGVKVPSVLMRTYMSSAVLASAAGLIMIARTNQARADYGESYILQAVLVNLLAGVNWAGGFGRVIGVAIAVVTLQFLSSGFNMLRFNNFARDFTWGVFLIAVMVFNYLMNERKARREAGLVASKTA